MLRKLLDRRWSTGTSLALVLALSVLGYLTSQAPLLSSRSGPSAQPHASTPAPARPTPTTAAKIEAAETEKSSWEDRWKKSNRARNSPARNRELAQLIEDLARTDPQRALALARESTDWRLRDLFRAAALRGWASVAPQAAGDWALNVRSEERRSAVEAVMQGAAKNPEAAVRLALRVCAADPEPAGDYGHYAIAALVDAGAFQQAVQFGNEVGSEKYPFLLKSAYFQWARNQPDQALAHLDSLSDPVLRSKARAEVISGWAWADAQGLAEHALVLAPGSERAEALAEALPRWVEKDPIAAAEWINRFDAGKDFDAGIAALANSQSLITQKPATALGLAGNITDGVARSETMRAVFRQWATQDPSAAKQYLVRTENAADRDLLNRELADLNP